MSGATLSGNSDNGVSCVGVPYITVSTCPVPNPMGYAQMGGAGTAASTETKFGAGVSITGISDPSNQITWNDTDNQFDITADGTYHVLATLSVSVASTTLPTFRIKKGTSVENAYEDHGVHSAEDPEEVTIQAVFECSSGDNINVTFQDDGAVNINLVKGSAVTVRRLF